jgi:hypothetical protein
VAPDELRDLKFPLPKGLTLLGFKPRGALAEWHQLKEATFVYPGERRGAGRGARRGE